MSGYSLVVQQLRPAALRTRVHLHLLTQLAALRLSDRDEVEIKEKSEDVSSGLYFIQPATMTADPVTCHHLFLPHR